MQWLKKHADSVAVIGAVTLATWCMTNQVHQVEKRSDEKMVVLKKVIDDRLVALEKDVAIIKTVLIMKETMPKELAMAVNEDSK